MKLRKIFLAFALLTAWLIPASAQRHYVPHVHVGAHAGVSLSQVSFFPSVKEAMLTGMQFGLSFRYAEERHVGLLAELNIEQRGWKENFEEDNDKFAYSRRTTYVQLPVMTHIFFGSRKVKCFFNLGPQVGYMISDGITANFDYEHPDDVKDFPGEYRPTAQMAMKIKNRFDYGIAGGLGMELVVAKKHSILLEGRYYYGLGNLFPSSKADEFSASRGNSIVVTLGYMFRIK